MTGTELERTPALFPGATPEAIIGVAAEAAAQFSDVVKKQRMFKRIGENDHVQIEAWQTIGALTGVLADDGRVTEIPWPTTIGELDDEPPLAGLEPRGDKNRPEWQAWNEADKTRRAWEHHRDLLRARALGKAYGFKAAFRAAKGGVPVGWGEGRCTRSEASKVNQEDYALASMAQTRAQSRALGAPLKFVVKLAGYETTPAEELDGTSASSSAPNGAAVPPTAAPWGPLADDEQENEAARSVRSILEALAGRLDNPDTPAQFVLALGQMFHGVPEASVVTLRGLAKLVAKLSAPRDASSENAPPPPPQSAYHQHPPGPDPNTVYPPGRYHGD
jgi:hypothetical protein